jgi:small neutral amino acid transporter SnatA (MarC family)
MKAITRIFGLFVAGFAIQFILDAVLLIAGI